MCSKVKEDRKKDSVSIMSRNMSVICIVQVILLCAWVTLVDTFIVILMDLMELIEGIA